MQFQQLESITIPNGKKIYFASDFHLGLPNAAKSLEREKLICKWLDSIAHDALHIFLLGDLFDAWLEYKNVVPKGYVRFLAKLANMRDAGIGISAFTGNHDLWMYGYFQQELNIPVYHNPICITINNKKFVLGHGDGLGPGDAGYKMLKKFLNNKICQWFYRWMHPDWGVPLARFFSEKGLDKKELEDDYKGDDKEFLVLFCKEYIQKYPVDYLLFGHRHYMKTLALHTGATYINLGDWIRYNSYAVFDGKVCSLKQFV